MAPIVSLETLEPRTLLSATVEGVAFFDGNLNGVMDEGEAGLEGWRIYVDLNEDGQWQGGEPNAVTDSTGAYSLTAPHGVLVHLRQEPQAGWEQTSPGEVIFNADFDEGDQYEDEGFTYVAHPDAPAAENLWNSSDVQWYEGAGYSQYFGIDGDFNYDTGERVAGGLVSPEITLPDLSKIEMSFNYLMFTGDPNDPTRDIPQVQITGDGGSTWETIAGKLGDGLYDNDEFYYMWRGNLSKFAGEDVQARFLFDSVDAQNNGGWGWFVDNFQVRTSGFGELVGQLEDGALYENVNYGNYSGQAGGAIEGRLYSDTNANGQYDDGEVGLEGRTVYLDLDNSGSLDAGEPTAVTDAEGSYAFEDVAPGTYTVGQVQEDGWTATSPGGAGSAPEFGEGLTDLWWEYGTSGGGLTIGVDGVDADGDPLQLHVGTDDPRLDATIPEGNRYALFHIVDENGDPVGDGEILAQLFEGRSPTATERFVILSENHVNSDGTYYESEDDPFYNDVLIHRIIDDFMWQSGDAQNGDGTGGSPLGDFADSFDPVLSFAWRGALAMANSGADTNDSQFFVTDAPTPWLNRKHMIFGQVVSGWDVYEQVISANTDTNNVPVPPLYISGIDIVDSPQDGTVTFTGPFNWFGESEVELSLTDPNGNTAITTITVGGRGDGVTPRGASETTVLHGVRRVTVQAYGTAGGVDFGNALVGDFDGNGAVNGLDIPDFKSALADPAGWQASTGRDPNVIGDFDGNGSFNGLDIPGFKSALSGGVAATSAPVEDAADETVTTASATPTVTSTSEQMTEAAAWMELQRLRSSRLSGSTSASSTLRSLLDADSADESAREVAAVDHLGIEVAE